MHLLGLQDSDLLIYWNGISIFTLLSHHNFHITSRIPSGRNENPFSFLKLKGLQRADHLQTAEAAFQMEGTIKGQGEKNKNLYCHKQHHCRAKGG